MKRWPYRWRPLVACLIALAGAPLAAGAASEITETHAADLPAFTQAQAVFEQALSGNSKALEQSLEQFPLLASSGRPVALVALAYLGASQTLQAREAWMPWTKMHAAEKGLATLDKALNRSTEAGELRFRDTPVQLEVKLVAAITFRQVPDAVFHRRDQGRRLVQEILSHRLFAGSPAVFRAQSWAEAATVARERNDRNAEIEALRQAVQAASGSSDAHAARMAESSQQRLKELGA